LQGAGKGNRVMGAQLLILNGTARYKAGITALQGAGKGNRVMGAQLNFGWQLSSKPRITALQGAEKGKRVMGSQLIFCAAAKLKAYNYGTARGREGQPSNVGASKCEGRS
jgi:hypothetical protein